VALGKAYLLEIYEPGNTHDILITLESDQPFMAIHEGSLLNPRVWEGLGNQGGLLRVVSLEHFIWETGGKVRHKIGLITEVVPDNSGSRTYRQKET
jgi:hypothetical protein